MSASRSVWSPIRLMSIEDLTESFWVCSLFPTLTGSFPMILARTQHSLCPAAEVVVIAGGGMSMFAEPESCVWASTELFASKGSGESAAAAESLALDGVPETLSSVSTTWFTLGQVLARSFTCSISLSSTNSWLRARLGPQLESVLPRAARPQVALRAGAEGGPVRAARGRAPRGAPARGRRLWRRRHVRRRGDAGRGYRSVEGIKSENGGL